MRHVVDVDNWKRYELFRHYHSLVNPFVQVCTAIDVTNLHKFCKENKKSFYATFGYVITKVINTIDGFKYRVEDDKVIYYDQIDASFTENIDNEIIGFFKIDINNRYEDFINIYNEKRSKLFTDGPEHVEGFSQNEVWISCAPWFSFSTVVPPFDRKNAIPQFIWDKIQNDNGKETVTLMIMVHHGFVDGYHLGLTINKIQEEINSFKGEM